MLNIEKNSNTGGLVEARMDIPLPDATSKNDDLDIMAQLNGMARAARQRKESGAGGLIVNPLGDIDFGGLLDGQTAQDPVRKKLRQVKKHVDKEEFDQALKLLEQIVEEHGEDNPEVVYLVAYCTTRLETDDVEGYDTHALTWLRKLHGKPLSPDLRMRVEALLQVIRDRREESVFQRFIEAFVTQDASAAQALLVAELELDPSNGSYWSLRARFLLIDERYVDALRCADEGMAACTGDNRQQCENVRNIARMRLVEKALNPALDAYRSGRYSDAIGKIAKLSQEDRDHPLTLNFEDYLRLLGGAKGFFSRVFSGTSTPQQTRPNLNGKPLDDLGFFITRRELDEGKSIDTENGGLPAFRNKESTFGRAYELAPWFPFANFLYGVAILVRVNKALEAHQLGDGDIAYRDLCRSRDLLARGKTDPELESAEAAWSAACGMIKAFDEAKAASERVMNEIKAYMNRVSNAIDMLKTRNMSPASFKSTLNTIRDELMREIRRTDNDMKKQGLQHCLKQVNDILQAIGSKF